MTPYNIYILIVCIFVFIALAGLFTYVVFLLIKLYKKTVIAGLEDEELKKEYIQDQEKRKKSQLLSKISTYAISGIFVFFFLASLYVNFQDNMFFEDIPTLKVVNSGSMSKKYEKNKYLFENELDNQFQTYDLLLLYKAPSEFELKKYDVVLYEVDDIYVIHRIIEIEEPNENHPNQRYFLCRGDANEYNDRFPVLYSQIKAIYKDQRIPFIGSFIAFLQSPAGWLCLIFTLFVSFGIPNIEGYIEQIELNRLIEIGFIKKEERIRYIIVKRNKKHEKKNK